MGCIPSAVMTGLLGVKKTVLNRAGGRGKAGIFSNGGSHFRAENPVANRVKGPAEK